MAASIQNPELPRMGGQAIAAIIYPVEKFTTKLLSQLATSGITTFGYVVLSQREMFCLTE